MATAQSVNAKPSSEPVDLGDLRAATLLLQIVRGGSVPKKDLDAIGSPWGVWAKAAAKRPADKRADYLKSLVDGLAHKPNEQARTRQALAAAEQLPPGDTWEQPRIGGLAEVPAIPFPLQVLPCDLQELIKQASTAMQCHPDYFGAVALGLAGGASGLSTVLRITNTWVERSDLAIVAVGDSGTRKSPVLKLLAGPLHKIDSELKDKYVGEYKQYQIELRDWEKSKESDRGAKPEAPIHGHLTLDDTTQEAVARIHGDNPRGLCVVMDELAAWVASLNAYRSGKGADRQFWLKVRSGSLVKVTRKGSDTPVVIPSPMVPVVGCLTPSGLPATCAGADDGWADRILFAFPDPDKAPPRRHTDSDVAESAIKAWEDAIRRLHKLPMVEDLDGKLRPFYVRFTDDAKKRWAKFVDEHNIETEDPDFDRSLRGPWSKMEGYCARLALILSQLRWAFDPDSDPSKPTDVGAKDVAGAVQLIAFFKGHLRRVRAVLTPDGDAIPDDARAILKWIQKNRLDRFSENDVNAQLGRFRKQPDRRATALQWLVDHACIRRMPDPPATGKRGRPGSATYETNPNLPA